MSRANRSNVNSIRAELQDAIAARRPVVVQYREAARGGSQTSVADGIPLRIALERGREHVVLEVVAGWTQRSVPLEAIVRVERRAA